MDLKDWVLGARKLKGWTQSELGDRLSVTKGNVSAWEKGRHEPSYGQLRAIAKMTGAPLPDATLAPDVMEALGAAPEGLRLQLENMLRAALGLPIVEAQDLTPKEHRSQVAPSSGVEETRWNSQVPEPTRVASPMKRQDRQREMRLTPAAPAEKKGGSL